MLAARTRLACCTQESKSNPYEEFARVFSMFASAEEVTKTGPRDEDEEAAPEEDEARETSEVKVSP